MSEEQLHRNAHDLLSWGLVTMSCDTNRTLKLNVTQRQVTLSILHHNRIVAKQTKRTTRTAKRKSPINTDAQPGTASP